MPRCGTLIVGVLAALLLAGVAYGEVQARQLRVAISGTCALMPYFADSYDYTVRTWPYGTLVIAEDVQQNLLYFATAMKTDRLWCDTTGLFAPEEAHKTMLWHFGNASQYLRLYQEAGKSQRPTERPLEGQRDRR